MAEGATIGALRFVLGADTAQLEAATGKASASMRAAARAGEVAGQQIASAMTRIGSIVAGAFAVDRIVQFGFQVLNTAADLRRFSDMAGMSTTQFQELQFALRNAGTTGEQMGVAFATFSRNLSDLQRGTGPLLDFLRQSAPQFISQFRAVRDVNEGFELLASILGRARTAHDALRLAQAAGGEQMGRIAMEAARLGPNMNRARQEAHEAGRVLGEHQVEQLRRARQAWQDFGDWVTVQSGRILAATAEIGRTAPTTVDRLEQALNNLSTQLHGARLIYGENSAAVERLTERWRRLWAEYERVAGAANNAATGIWRSTGAIEAGINAAARSEQTWQAQNNAVRALQGSLALYQAQIQNVLNLENFRSAAFEEQWNRQRAVLAAQGATQAEMAAARINLLMQEDATRLRIMGGQLSAEETYRRREAELRAAAQQGIISEIELRRLLLGAQMASVSGFLSSTGQVLGSLSQIFHKQKAWAYAAAVVQTAAAVTAAMAMPPYWPFNAPQVAAAVAAGAAQIAAISRTSMSGTSGGVPSVAGGAAGGAATGPTQAPQMVSINLAPGRYSRDDVVGLIEQINEAVSDGAQIRIAA